MGIEEKIQEARNVYKVAYTVFVFLTIIRSQKLGQIVSTVSLLPSNKELMVYYNEFSHI